MMSDEETTDDSNSLTGRWPEFGTCSPTPDSYLFCGMKQSLGDADVDQADEQGEEQWTEHYKYCLLYLLWNRE